MELTEDDIKRIKFLTRTSLSVNRIGRLARVYDNIDNLIDKINKMNYPDLDKDWTLYDIEYKKNKLVYAKHTKFINEKDIFKGTYIHKCKNGRDYIIQIIGKSGYCRRCDTQFFPKIWWEHPLRETLGYKEIKYGENVKNIPVDLEENYESKLYKIGVNQTILDNANSKVFSPYEIEKILNTKYYDWKNPPPPSRVHYKLMMLHNLWETRPVLRLGIFPDAKYFFHKCNKNTERILFQEKLFYPWCPACYTKFIPEWDKETIEKYENLFTVDCYTGKEYSNDSNQKSDNGKREIRIDRNSHEYFYLSMLGLNDRCSIKELQSVFRKLSKVYHPDFGGNSEMFQKIVKAKNWLLKFYTSLVSKE